MQFWKLTANLAIYHSAPPIFAIVRRHRMWRSLSCVSQSLTTINTEKSRNKLAGQDYKLQNLKISIFKSRSHSNFLSSRQQSVVLFSVCVTNKEKYNEHTQEQSCESRHSLQNRVNQMGVLQDSEVALTSIRHPLILTLHRSIPVVLKALCILQMFPPEKLDQLWVDALRCPAWNKYDLSLFPAWEQSICKLNAKGTEQENLLTQNRKINLDQDLLNSQLELLTFPVLFHFDIVVMPQICFQNHNSVCDVSSWDI